MSLCIRTDLYETYKYMYTYRGGLSKLQAGRALFSADCRVSLLAAKCVSGSLNLCLVPGLVRNTVHLRLIHVSIILNWC